VISTFEEWAPRRRLRLPFCQQATSEFRRESLPGADCDVICARREDAMLRKPSCLLALVVLLCAIAQARGSAADGPPFIGRLPQGTVELVGITYHPEMVGITYHPPTKQSRWWQPDGSAANLDLIPPQSKSRLKLFANENVVAFLVRYENLPADASRPAWGISPWAATWYPGHWSSAWARESVSVLDHYGQTYAPTSNEAKDIGSVSVLDHYGQTVSNFEIFSVSRGAPDLTADCRVGIAKGAWETVITQNAQNNGRRTFSRDGEQWTVIFRKATAVASGGAQVKLAYTVPYGRWNMQLVAAASDGSEHASSTTDGFSGGSTLSGSIYRGYATEIAVFQDLPLSSIKEFRLQVRPYDWVEFKNVSLKPGQKTDVKVVSPKGF
jgi:hypothetical protein